MPERRREIAEVLRRRILGLVRAGTLKGGDRLPSTRELGREFDTDPRVIQGAYRLLAEEQLVVQRQRSGVFVNEPRIRMDRPGLSALWLAELFADALARDVPAAQLPNVLQRALATRPIRVATVTAVIDQNEGMCRELRDDFGLRATCVSTSDVLGGPPYPQALRDAELIVTTEAQALRVREVGTQLGVPVIAISVRRDLLGQPLKEVLLDKAYMVVADPNFVPVLKKYFGSQPRGQNVQFLVVGRDDLDAIPATATVYVTTAAADRIGNRRLPGRRLPPARVFSTESAREILHFVIRRNLEADMTQRASRSPDPWGGRSRME